MKMSAEHYTQLDDQVRVVLDRNDMAAYLAQLEDDPRVTDIEKRIRWDVLWATPADFHYPWFDETYAYLNDTHIDTALRQIFRTRKINHA